MIWTLQLLPRNTGYDTRRRALDGVLARLSQTAFATHADRLRPRLEAHRADRPPQESFVTAMKRTAVVMASMSTGTSAPTSHQWRTVAGT